MQNNKSPLPPTTFGHTYYANDANDANDNAIDNAIDNDGGEVYGDDDFDDDFEPKIPEVLCVFLFNRGDYTNTNDDTARTFLQGTARGAECYVSYLRLFSNNNTRFLKLIHTEYLNATATSKPNMIKRINDLFDCSDLDMDFIDEDEFY